MFKEQGRPKLAEIVCCAKAEALTSRPGHRTAPSFSSTHDLFMHSLSIMRKLSSAHVVLIGCCGINMGCRFCRLFG